MLQNATAKVTTKNPRKAILLLTGDLSVDNTVHYPSIEAPLLEHGTGFPQRKNWGAVPLHVEPDAAGIANRSRLHAAIRWCNVFAERAGAVSQA